MKNLIFILICIFAFAVPQKFSIRDRLKRRLLRKNCDQKCSYVKALAKKFIQSAFSASIDLETYNMKKTIYLANGKVTVELKQSASLSIFDLGKKTSTFKNGKKVSSELKASIFPSSLITSLQNKLKVNFDSKIGSFEQTISNKFYNAKVSYGFSLNKVEMAINVYKNSALTDLQAGIVVTFEPNSNNKKKMKKYIELPNVVNSKQNVKAGVTIIIVLVISVIFLSTGIPVPAIA